MDGDETGRKKFGPDSPRCVVARVPPTAPWRQGTVTQPSGPPRGHGCAPIKNYFNLPYLIIYLGIPTYFCRLFLIRSQYSRNIGLSLRLTDIPPRRVLLSVYHKSPWTNDEDRRRVIPVVLLFFSILFQSCIF